MCESCITRSNIYIISINNQQPTIIKKPMNFYRHTSHSRCDVYCWAFLLPTLVFWIYVYISFLVVFIHSTASKEVWYIPILSKLMCLFYNRHFLQHNNANDRVKRGEYTSRMTRQTQREERNFICIFQPHKIGVCVCEWIFF